MILRLLHLFVIGVLILAAADVYRIKFESTVQAERLAKIRDAVRHERDKIAALRAEWSELDRPARIEALAKRYLKLALVAPTQFDRLDDLPDRPPPAAGADSTDPIGSLIEDLAAARRAAGMPTPAAASTSDSAAKAQQVSAQAAAASASESGAKAQQVSAEAAAAFATDSAAKAQQVSAEAAAAWPVGAPGR
ncbi:MAG TPA: hypothetical protein VGJ20_17695 [Xanthobacteraceae bacterium]